jgi:hypothetical protein
VARLTTQTNTNISSIPLVATLWVAAVIVCDHTTHCIAVK